jgi:NADP-dependent 3-hydroxy acid dehydrogenase YdfG
MPSLRDQVIAITGASSGIGAATAVACARAGMHVALGARRVDKLKAVAAQVEALGRRALPLACDVDRDEDVDALIAQTLAVFGRLDAAFANAGYGLMAPVMETTDAQMRAIFETNFYGTLRVIRAAVPAMRAAGRGHLLICSSAASEVALPFYGAYAATKAAQDAVAGTLRAELAGEGIHVTSVHPVGTGSEFFDAVRRGDGGVGAPANSPVAVQQTPEQVARAIVRAMGRRHPPPEVWPMGVARFALAAGTAFPRVTASVLRQTYRRTARRRGEM